MIDPAEREAAAVEILDAWPWELGGALIGGYAVAAYGAPRYSDDLDVVVSLEALEPTIEWLTTEHGFVELQVPEDLIQNYAGKVGRWTNGSVVVDLLPGVVRDREALVDVPESWITRDPILERMILMDTSTRNPVPVVRREAFWALKIQAGRHRDFGDLMSIGGQGTDFSEVRDLFSSLKCDSLYGKLRNVLVALEDEKLYVDALSHRQRGSPKLPKNVDAWEKLKANVAACMPPDLQG